jgi:hypothetical protein
MPLHKATQNRKQTKNLSVNGALIPSMRVGDTVRLIAIPPGLEDFPDLPTKSTFKRCVGKQFTVTAVTEKGWAELPIGSVTGNKNEKIYVSPDFLEIISK